MKQTCQSCKRLFEPTPCVLFDVEARCPKCRRAAADRYASLGWGDKHWATVEMNSGVPGGFLLLHEGPGTVAACVAVKHAFEAQKGLCCVGQSGSGKTLTLVVLAKRLIQYGVPVAFINVPQFSAWLRANADKHEAQRQRLCNVRHLILDDMGAEYDKSGWWGAWLLSVMDARYGTRRATSSSCNDHTVIDARVYRRLTEYALTVEL